MLKYFWILVFVHLAAFAEPSEISVRPLGMSEAEHNQLKESILQYPNVQEILRNKIFRVVELEVDDLSQGPSQYTLHIYNYTDDQMLEVSGPINRSTSPQIKESTEDIPATPEEFEDAVKILTEDPQTGPAINAGTLQAYEPMPASGKMSLGGGRAKPARIIYVGLNSASDPKAHEIVGVDLLSKQVIHFPSRAPDDSVAAEAVCGLPNARQANTAKGVRGSAEIEIKRGGQTFWKFTVVRPSASSGRNGSGLEIRNLLYKGKKVLTRAHTPILNVQYEGNRCGPFRDWAYSENPFTAVGTDRAPGIRITTVPPQTIFDTQQDRGNFRGVAIHSTDDRVTLVTELAAGWYRYVSKFELYNDGTIKPVFQFSAVENSCVCFSHNHHVYWRLDFDVAGTPNAVLVSNGSSFRTVTNETSMLKNANNRFWRIRNQQAGLGYDLLPGPNDGAADAYSIADAWLLRYAANQIDDASVRTSTRAGLNAFLTGGNLINQDVVMWYAGHFVHSTGEAETQPHMVGPTLSPVGW